MIGADGGRFKAAGLARGRALAICGVQADENPKERIA
jgi:hypothetical protein